jgi:hypothetical protein
MRISLGLALGLILAASSLQAQLVINELASRGNLADEDGLEWDWIELYNAGPTSVNLADYYLSDDIDIFDKWQLPAAVLNPGEYFVALASGLDRRQSVDHYETVVNNDDSWSYFVGTTNPDPDWNSLTYDASLWPVGDGGFGYGDGDDNTVTPAPFAVYSRIEFNVVDTANIGNIVLHMDYDDGYVAYLNGVEIGRENLVGAPPLFGEAAFAMHEAELYQGIVPEFVMLNQAKARELLRNGSNVLAVQVHNANTTSSDLTSNAFLTLGISDASITYGPTPVWFDLDPTQYFSHTNFRISGDGELIQLHNNLGVLVDEYDPGSLSPNHSAGRQPDGAASWCVFDAPTAAQTNNDAFCYLGYEPDPKFNIEGGFYNGTQLITITSTSSTAEIHLTVDGSEPEITDPVFSSSFTLPAAGIIVAKSFSSANLLPSNTVRNTYMIDEAGINVPVFALSTDPANLFDPDTGIYVNATGSSTDEVVGYVEYWDRNKEPQFELPTAIQMHGGASVETYDQKSFRIDTKNKLGGRIEYPLFREKPDMESINNVNLRNGGNNHELTIIQDAYAQRVGRTLDLEYMAWEPAHLFLNGQYWGYYSLREKQSPAFIEDNYGIDENDLDVIESNAWFGSGALVADAGSDTGYTNLRDYMTSTPPTDPNYFNRVNQSLDIPNFADYFITRIQFHDTDWLTWPFYRGNNVFVWREQGGGKWRYGLWDLDISFGQLTSINANFINQVRNAFFQSAHNKIFDKGMDNPELQRYFINRYADLLNTRFQPSVMDPILQDMRDSVVNELPKQIARWGNIPSIAYWDDQLEDITAHTAARTATARDHLISSFGLIEEVVLTLDVLPAGAGQIKINTIIPDTYPWDGVYFNGNPVEIIAVPNPGFSFDSWLPNALLGGPGTNDTLDLNLDFDETFTAVFNNGLGSDDIAVSEIYYNQESSLNSEDWFELYNKSSVTLDLSGWTFRDQSEINEWTFPAGVLLNSGDYLVVVQDSLAFDSVYSGISNYVGAFGFGLGNGGDQIRLFDALGNPVIAMTYDDSIPWPQGADGTGRTLELVDLDADLSAAASWFDGCIGGSPGTSYTVCGTTVVFSEINYNSADSLDAEDWVELYNPTGSAIDLSNWVFKDDDDTHNFMIPAGTILNPDEYLVLIRDDARFTARHPLVTNKLGEFTFGLSAAGELIRLYDDAGNLVEAVIYNDAEPWPLEADGEGPTLEFALFGEAVNDPTHWVAGCDEGSPGQAYDFACTPCVEPVNLNAVAEITSADLSWDAVAGSELYQLKGGVLGSGSGAVLSSENEKSVGGLSPATSYYWQVRVRCLSGAISGFSVLDTFTTNPLRESALEVIEEQPLKILTYPNPVQDMLYVYLKGDLEMHRIQVVDLQGRVYFDEQNLNVHRGEAAQVPASEWHSGVYMLRVFHGEEMTQSTFVKF